MDRKQAFRSDLADSGSYHPQGSRPAWSHFLCSLSLENSGEHDAVVNWRREERIEPQRLTDPLDRREEEERKAGSEDHGRDVDLDDIQGFLLKKTRSGDRASFDIDGVNSAFVEGSQDLSGGHKTDLSPERNSKETRGRVWWMTADEDDRVETGTEEGFETGQVCSEHSPDWVVPLDGAHCQLGLI